MSSCAIHQNTWRKGDLSFNNRSHYSKAWGYFLDARKDTMLQSWCLSASEDSSWKEFYKIEYSENDIPDLALTALYAYSLDSMSLFDSSANSDFGQYLRLDTTMAQYCVKNSRKNKYISDVYPLCVNGKWQNVTIIAGMPNGREPILNDYIEKGEKVFLLNVYYGTSKYKRRQYQVVYVDDAYKCISVFGKVTLLKDEIQAFKTHLVNIQSGSAWKTNLLKGSQP